MIQCTVSDGGEGACVYVIQCTVCPEHKMCPDLGIHLCIGAS